jgi:hypothetical protein
VAERGDLFASLLAPRRRFKLEDLA